MNRLLLMVLSTYACAVEMAPDPAQDGVRLKDLCFVEGVRENQLNGVGVVVGLSGSGDKAPAVLKALKSFVERNRINVAESDLSSKNVALVAITGRLPPFTRSGSRIEVEVSTLGDANSLKGGMLLQSLLIAFDGKVYASAQGSLSIGGFGKAGPGLVPTGNDHQGPETVARLVDGAMVEQEVPVSLLTDGELRLVLKQPDFLTANRVAQRLSAAFGSDAVQAKDAGAVALRFHKLPTQNDLIQLIAQVEELRVRPDTLARVVINERTGTVVIGREVRIDTCAVSHAGLSLQVRPVILERQDPENPGQSQRLVTWINPVTEARSDQTPAGIVANPEGIPGSATVVQGTTVEAIANALNALGARPKDLVAIFQAIRQAGALHAELVVL